MNIQPINTNQNRQQNFGFTIEYGGELPKDKNRAKCCLVSLFKMLSNEDKLDIFRATASNSKVVITWGDSMPSLVHGPGLHFQQTDSDNWFFMPLAVSSQTLKNYLAGLKSFFTNLLSPELTKMSKSSDEKINAELANIFNFKS